MAKQNPQPEPQKPGPKPERLKLDTDWETAADKLLAKPRPKEGWPKAEGDEPPPPKK